MKSEELLVMHDCGVGYLTITKTMIINGSVTRIIDTISRHLRDTEALKIRML